MKMADILRNLADKLENIESGGESSDRPENTAKTAGDFQNDVEDGAESGDKEVSTTEKMMPPLQQQLELQKKGVGMENAFDEAGSDELGDIKKLTGIKAVIGNE